MRKWLGLMCLLVLSLCLLGCKAGADGDEEQQNIVQVYYINRDETAIRAVEYQVTSVEKTEAVAEL